MKDFDDFKKKSMKVSLLSEELYKLKEDRDNIANLTTEEITFNLSGENSYLTIVLNETKLLDDVKELCLAYIDKLIINKAEEERKIISEITDILDKIEKG